MTQNQDFVYFDEKACEEIAKDMENRKFTIGKSTEFARNKNMPEFDLSTEELWMILSKVCTEQQIRQNNWRKLHGIPMRRKKR